MAKTAAERKAAQRDRERYGIGAARDTPLSAATIDAALLKALSRLSADPSASSISDLIALASCDFAIPSLARPRIYGVLRDRRQRNELREEKKTAYKQIDS